MLCSVYVAIPLTLAHVSDAHVLVCYMCNTLTHSTHIAHTETHMTHVHIYILSTLAHIVVRVS